MKHSKCLFVLGTLLGGVAISVDAAQFLRADFGLLRFQSCLSSVHNENIPALLHFMKGMLVEMMQKSGLSTRHVED
jgi:hypothetical protein